MNGALTGTPRILQPFKKTPGDLLQAPDGSCEADAIIAPRIMPGPPIAGTHLPAARVNISDFGQ